MPVTGSRRIARLYENERDITGQSDILGNLILTYTNFERGVDGSLGLQLHRLIASSWWAPKTHPTSSRSPAVSWTSCFATASRAFGRDLEAELKIKNLLDEQVDWTQGDLLYERYDPGISYSLGVRVTI